MLKKEHVDVGAVNSREQELGGRRLSVSNFEPRWRWRLDRHVMIRRSVGPNAPPLRTRSAHLLPTVAAKVEAGGTSLIVAYLLAHLVVCLRHTYPIAIGLTPPVFFCKATSLPPKITGLTISGISPRNSKLTKEVSDLSATCQIEQINK